jgi:hypothetical protein
VTDTALNDGDGTQADTNDGEGAQAEIDSVNDNENGIDNNKNTSQNKSPKDDTKWSFCGCVDQCRLLLMFILRTVPHAPPTAVMTPLNKRSTEEEGSEKMYRIHPAAAAARMAADHDAACDPTETDRDFSEHPDIQEIRTGQGASETSSV